ncbi:MAG TPA: transcription termination factor NusA [Candidatus Saccharimonadales bacterium]|nr:transcription termination factor NusA [Candidatus Saccharimonadales bacterium]
MIKLCQSGQKGRIFSYKTAINQLINVLKKRENKQMDLDMKQLAVAIRTIAEEKNLPEESVKEVVEQALAAAYKRDYGDREQEIRVEMNLNTGDIDVYITKDVVEKVEHPAFEISLSDAQVMKKNIQVGDTIEVHEKAEQFGRVAAQTAKQVILQRLREAEREVVMLEYEDKIGTVINAAVSRVEGNIVRIDLGKAQGIMPKSEQIQGERYYPGQRLKVYLKDVERGFRGPQLVVSRGNKEFIEWLFRAEVPEMENGAVEIKNIAREAGVRSKIAVASNVPGVDPVGTFVGGHGTRVNAVVSEVGEQEKIDIVVWADDPVEYITQALSPTKVNKVIIDETAKKARVFVPDDQLSIAIGKSGQNVRLASKLTGYELDIESEKVETAPVEPEEGKVETTELPKAPRLKKKNELENSLLDAIEEHGE